MKEASKPKFKKHELIGLFTLDSDIANAALCDSKEYTVEEAKSIVTKFKKGKVM